MKTEEIEELIARHNARFHLATEWVTEELHAKTVDALRFLLQEREWKPADTAPKDEEILGLTLEWNDGKRPILLRWFNYNGLEAWRDFEAESNTLICWRPLPSPPQSQGDRPDEEGT
jgi:hypothetical protein